MKTLHQIVVAIIVSLAPLAFNDGLANAADPIRVATFDIDASPPIGSPLAYDPTIEIQTPLSLRGIVILSEQKPIVLAAIDWIGIANESQTLFKEAMAQAAGTTPDRVTLHAIHQHDAPLGDFSAGRLMQEFNVKAAQFDNGFQRELIERAAKAVADAKPKAKIVTHIGTGEAAVKKVASNRRILGEDGRVKVTRYTATKDPKVRAMPVGTIDPMLKLISFHSEDNQGEDEQGQPIAVLTYYACHPQSYYRTGKANPDFPGLARNARQAETKSPHIHFNGAGGNIGAGKWNDGDPANRQVLADRVADGMRRAWESIEKVPVDSSSMKWKTADIVLPLGKHLNEQELLKKVADNSLPDRDRGSAARDLVWARRTLEKMPVTISCLSFGKTHILHMPGELFVEYQLAAQQMKPDDFVAMAAYGDYGPGYIGTEIAYSQGGYETSERASRVAPEVEDLLLSTMRDLLEAKE